VIRWIAELIESCLLHVCCSVCCYDQMNRWVDWVTFVACVLKCVLQRSNELLCWLSHVDMSAVSRNESLCIVLVCFICFIRFICFIWICTECDSCKKFKKKVKIVASAIVHGWWSRLSHAHALDDSWHACGWFLSHGGRSGFCHAIKFVRLTRGYL